ncbi:phosphotransferase [Nocardiopsis terrae]|uniref:Phosphocarrier protein HPr n=1 Tax=Nocardiopsis terrae TaxID=372655 RepID=A0ABR9HAZ1_9ACTN|nr:HPr family phosphocarrier protein [Nocardiopsis terrae]MBE1456190.1 phosphotransferase system HPr (HPr) family protein [Nocardiopsis terrae]GHC98081.1 phosphotransferase [Nocardiopsis terrae]
MPERTVVIGSQLGLHARPAALFVQAVNETGLAVTVARQGQRPVDARSVLSVMSLGASHGESVTLSCADEGSEEALDGLVELLAKELDPR